MPEAHVDEEPVGASEGELLVNLVRGRLQRPRKVDVVRVLITCERSHISAGDPPNISTSLIALAIAHRVG